MREAARMNPWPAPVPSYVTNNRMVTHWADRPIYLDRGAIAIQKIAIRSGNKRQR